MAIVGSVFAMLGRFAGRLLNSALGWATILLFGKVEGRRQSFLLVMALGSLAYESWLVRRQLPTLRTMGVKAILGASLIVNLAVLSSWVVLWFRYW